MIALPELWGERVTLRGLRPSDADDYVRWERDEEIFHLANYGQPFSPPTEDETRAQVARMIERAETGPDGGEWAKGHWEIDTEAGRHIGHVGYYPINRFARSTKIAIAIYERETWGRGYGSEALGILLGYLFGTKKLHRVELQCRAENRRMIRCAEKNGFALEGTLRDSFYCYQQQRHCDEAIMAVLARDIAAADPDQPRGPGGRA